MMGSRYISILLAAAILLGPANLYAQAGGMDFSADPNATGETGDSTGALSAVGDNGSQEEMDFTAENTTLQSQTKSDENSLRPGKVAVVALSGDNLPAPLRVQIENTMMAVLNAMPGEVDPRTVKARKDVVDGNTYVGSETVINSLQKRGMEHCVLTGSICLNAVARENKVDAMIMAYIQRDESGLKNLVIDYVDQRLGLTVNTEKQPVTTNQDALNLIEPMLYSLFSVRKAPPAPKAPVKSIVSPILAWSSLALSLGAAGAGGYFTYTAKKLDDKLQENIGKGMTQVDAFSDNEVIKQKQTVSFVFYGLAAGFLAASVTFFVIDIGADVSEEQATASIRNLKLAPLFSPDGAGIFAGFNF